MHTVRDTLAPLDADQVAFWLAISQPRRFNIPKLQVAIVRCLLGALIVLAVLAVLALLGDAVRPRALNTFGMKRAAIHASVVIVSGALMLAHFVGGLHRERRPRQHRPNHRRRSMGKACSRTGLVRAGLLPHSQS